MMAEKGTYVTSARGDTSQNVVKLITSGGAGFLRENISIPLVIWRVQFKEIGCQGVRKWEKRVGATGIGCFTCISISSLVGRTVGRVRNM